MGRSTSGPRRECRLDGFVWAYWSNQSTLLGGKATTRHFEKDPGSSRDGNCISQQFVFFEDNGTTTMGQSRHGSSMLLNALSAMDGQIRRARQSKKRQYLL
ncbi:hypothetical protein LB504_011840 [Fusarium proliferatum]|nr:hypothetical protein LB504_011840 [Fusarium proliferatum]